MKNRKPILQTKAQKTAKVTNSKRQACYCWLVWQCNKSELSQRWDFSILKNF